MCIYIHKYSYKVYIFREYRDFRFSVLFLTCDETNFILLYELFAELQKL